MANISFTIYGNPEDPDGNPIPKLKMTGKQQWTPKAQRYKRWKVYVQSAFIERITNQYPDLKSTVFSNMAAYGKPIDMKSRARMSIMICWKDNRRPDPENVFGSIADALFYNDKNLSGVFDHASEPVGKGSVHVLIEF